MGISFESEWRKGDTNLLVFIPYKNVKNCPFTVPLSLGKKDTDKSPCSPTTSPRPVTEVPVCLGSPPEPRRVPQTPCGTKGPSRSRVRG